MRKRPIISQILIPSLDHQVLNSDRSAQRRGRIENVQTTGDRRKRKEDATGWVKQFKIVKMPLATETSWDQKRQFEKS